MLQDARLRTTLPALDLGRARRFYAETLGLRVVSESSDGIAFEVGPSAATRTAGWAESATFFVFATPNPNRGGHTQMGFFVDDIDAMVSHLRGAGVVFEEYDLPGLATHDGIASIGGGRGKGAWFNDTEGNLIGLVEFGR